MSHFILALPFYLFILAEWLFSSVTLFSVSLCSFLWSPVSSICFLSCSGPLLVWKYVWQNIQPWGYIASFMWGPVVTLKACYVVCRFASAQLLLSVLRTLVCARLSTWSLPGWKHWLVENSMPAPAGYNRANVYALVLFKNCQLPVWQIDAKIHKYSVSVEMNINLPCPWHSDPLVKAFAACLFVKGSRW